MRVWTRPGAARVAAAVMGVVMEALPAVAVPAAALPLAAAGLLAVLAAAVPGQPAGLGLRWAHAGTVAAAAAVAQCVAGSLPAAALAAEGLLIVCYLILLDAPPRLSGPGARRWAAGQVPGVLAGCAVAGVVLAALAVPGAASPWIALAGLAAAAAAYLFAVPRSRRP